MTNRLDSPFYPFIGKPRQSGTLAVDQRHSIYWEECGIPDGVPLLVLHGGPGGSIRSYYRQLADPEYYRIVLFDQRGCGNSTPYAELQDNTTQYLVDDIESLRRNLGIDSWFVLGGSWGSLLAISYALAFPDSIRGITVSGVFLGRESDVDWWWRGAGNVYPEAWHRLRNTFANIEVESLAESLLAMILDSNRDIALTAAKAFLEWETETLDVWPPLVESDPDDDALLASAKIFAHYMSQGFFIEQPIEERLEKATHIPLSIINGRFDMCTPPRAAYDLHSAWPGSSLEVVPCAGHRWSDPLIAAAVVRVTDGWRRL